jgi:hypothetical protein
MPNVSLAKVNLPLPKVPNVSLAQPTPQVTPSAPRISVLSAAPLGFASGTAEALKFTPTDPSEPSAPLASELGQ